MTAAGVTAAERFWVKVEKTDTCWLWRGALGRWGYGNFGLDGKTWRAHRLAYTLLVGPIPAGLDLDHLCRVRSCVNPAHLEPVTRRENSLRGMSPTVVLHRSGICGKGHRLFPENLWRDGKHVRCATCRRETNRKYRARRRARRAAA